jgi:hypothetical protein
MQVLQMLQVMQMLQILLANPPIGFGLSRETIPIHI